MTEVNSNLFGEPTKYGTSVHVPNETGGGRAGVDWRDYTPAELARKGFEAICNPKNYMPEELHQFPFDEDETVQVFVKDTTKIGGYDFVTKAKDALQEANDKAAMIIRAERGNAITEANIRLGNVNFRLPAFGKNHVWFS